jgi:hypothetical protein
VKHLPIIPLRKSGRSEQKSGKKDDTAPEYRIPYRMLAKIIHITPRRYAFLPYARRKKTAPPSFFFSAIGC